MENISSVKKGKKKNVVLDQNKVDDSKMLLSSGGERWLSHGRTSPHLGQEAVTAHLQALVMGSGFQVPDRRHKLDELLP